jgi:hypothetical protein
MAFAANYAAELAAVTHGLRHDVAIRALGDRLFSALDASLCRPGDCADLLPTLRVLAPTGSVPRGTFDQLLPDFDYVAVVADLPSGSEVHEVGTRLIKPLEETLARHYPPGAASASPPDRRGSCTVRRVGPSSFLIAVQLFAPELGLPGADARTFIEVQLTVQTLEINLRYDNYFCGVVMSYRGDTHASVMGEIRLLKSILRRGGIYGAEEEGIPGHLVEQLVMQHREDTPGGGLHAVMRLLATALANQADPVPPPVFHPGYVDRRDMWTLVERYGQPQARSVMTGLGDIASCYVELQKKDAPWTVSYLLPREVPKR